jgi:hypothetical protein
VIYGFEPLSDTQINVCEHGSGHYGVAEVRPAEVRQAEVRPGEDCPAEMRLADVRLDEHRPAEVRQAEVRLAEYRPAEHRPAEVRADEVRPAEVRPAEVRLAEVRLHVRILFPPLIPNLHPLLQYLQMLLIRHTHPSPCQAAPGRRWATSPRKRRDGTVDPFPLQGALCVGPSRDRNDPPPLAQGALLHSIMVACLKKINTVISHQVNDAMLSGQPA